MTLEYFSHKLAKINAASSGNLDRDTSGRLPDNARRALSDCYALLVDMQERGAVARLEDGGGVVYRVAINQRGVDDLAVRVRGVLSQGVEVTHEL